MASVETMSESTPPSARPQSEAASELDGGSPVLDTPPTVRDAIVLAVNGEIHTVRGAAAFGTLSDFLRQQLRLTGTKIVCSEGDCGACSVLVGELDDDGQFGYRSIDSCIAFVFQLDRCHVISVDGLAQQRSAQRLEELHPVQRVMAENYGSQCGFCTPGFVIAMTDMAARARREQRSPCAAEVGTALSGNLCRCTGYVQIAEAFAAIDLDALPAVGELFDEAPIRAVFDRERERSVLVEHGSQAIEIPATEPELLAARVRRPRARIVAGATDLGVRSNKGQLEPCDWLHLRNDIVGFSAIDWNAETRRLRLGAAVRWADALVAFDDHAPEFAEILRRFGGPQIRNMGTVGGNLINASPIADSLPFFYAGDAQLELVSEDGPRTVAIADFYRGYKTLDLGSAELLRSVSVRISEASRGERMLLLKASRRRDLDISTFTAALWFRLDGAEIGEVRVAYGGVGPTVVRLPKTEQVLVGQQPSLVLFERAGEMAASEVTPISDMRGAAAYRSLLARNVMLRFAQQIADQPDGRQIDSRQAGQKAGR